MCEEPPLLLPRGHATQRRSPPPLGCGVRSTAAGQQMKERSSDESTPSPPLLQRCRWGAPLRLDCADIKIREARVLLHVESHAEEERFVREYEVNEILGYGTTGVVRRARRRSDGLEVCLKTVRTEDAQLADLVLEEYRLIVGLQHPHIVRAFGFHSLPGSSVLVLELFNGPTLQEAVRRRPGRRLSEEASRPLFAALLSAVAYLHKHGIVHRDVKAENVLVAEDLSDLRLIDFNTARRLADGGALTMTGTQQWAAPEVLRGESPGKGSDVWSLGLCVHLMLAGCLPQRCERFSSLEAYATAMVDTAGALRGRRWQGVSEACKATLRSCLQADSELRTTAAALEEDSAWLNQGTLD
mmetsp:Transcript_19927/g.62240  ORF Transcript_19927/g.62240 Transcript_19927/m.62240 type:complete len:356 (-) Transcript_19927:87-1154(-)